MKTVPPSRGDHGKPFVKGGLSHDRNGGFMDIIALRRQGCSLREISRKLGIHRTTVKKYLTEGQPPRYQNARVANRSSIPIAR